MDENLKRMKNHCFFSSLKLCVFSSRVAFCIIFYLTCTTPSLWIIHVETANRKLYRLAENKFNARAAALSVYTHLPNSSFPMPRTFPTDTPLVLSIGHIECHDKVNENYSIQCISSFFYSGMVLHGRTTLA